MLDILFVLTATVSVVLTEPVRRQVEVNANGINMGVFAANKTSPSC